VALVQQIWHGDSVELCERFKPGRVNCIVTDPPFGVDNQSNMAVTAGGKEYARKIANDESPEQAIKVFHDVMRVLLPKTSNNCDMYIFTAHQVLKEWLQVADDLAPYGFHRKALLIWEKDGPGMGDLNSWGMGHEIIIFLKKGNRAATAPRRSGVLHVPQLRPKDLIHPHEKPVPLLQMLLKHSTSEGDFVVDPFGGSGSLARAAREIDRSAVAIELDEKNYKLSLDKFNSQEEGLL
jgi:adenine-specific DNA-methyltransferase